MRYAVIDVGSNSVRLMISENGHTLSKDVKITKLVYGFANGNLSLDSVQRTVEAVSFFVEVAKNKKVDKILIFATAGVRSAVNKSIVIDSIFQKTSIMIDVISGEKESKIGALGALNGLDGGVIDIGGASSEIAIVKDSDIVFSHSVDIGCVKLTNICGQDRLKAKQIINNYISEYGLVPNAIMYGIGGTITSLSAMLQNLQVYDSNLVDKSIIKKHQLSNLVDKLYVMTVEQRKNYKSLQPQRADVIANGANILLEIMNYLNINSIIVSESDNLEGYLIDYLENYEQKN